ncbi:hypothetical protein Y1Q_0004737 [Alligator mississippiensis]|uniref:Uncharacterized protein n=1 Tax=Alligator mississippiensis TaxID=8496 RepID=A0A151N475_ALLMI|nr:hypothetical protein Y1Q_0004737 [Alligator mississippiensis]
MNETASEREVEDPVGNPVMEDSGTSLQNVIHRPPLPCEQTRQQGQEGWIESFAACGNASNLFRIPGFQFPDL